MQLLVQPRRYLFEYITVYRFQKVGNLSILSERKLSKALNEFVLKDEANAIPELVKWQLRKTQKELKSRNLEEEKIEDEISKIKGDDENVDEEKENEEIEQVRSCLYGTENLDQPSFLVPEPPVACFFYLFCLQVLLS